MPHIGDFAPAQTQQAYRPAVYLNGWVDFSISYYGASYFKDANGFVHLRGLLKSGTMAASAFSLPAGYRPGNNTVYCVISNNAIGRVDVQANGDVLMAAGSNLWISLDGITFKAEA